MIKDQNLTMLTDFYELTMANGYFQVWEDELEEIENALREAYY